ncbi:MAG TPA: DUF1761 domain-containing protein [Candidatus Paceibacterota bacterium]|nr:DUF1761 domain-containing protein [Candidatus Paceibacterota bacterium]
MEVMINFWAVLVAAVAAVALGFFWFGALFGKAWMRTLEIEMPKEITKSMKRQMLRSYAFTTVGALVMATVLAHAIYYVSEFMEVRGMATGVTVALWCWLGFVALPLVGSVFWEDRPWKYWFIVAGYWLTALVVMGGILASWG